MITFGMNLATNSAVSVIRKNSELVKTFSSYFMAVRRALKDNGRDIDFFGKKSKEFDDRADALAKSLHHAAKFG